jgi:hypothetical protein
MPDAPQTNLRRVNGFDGAPVHRQSMAMRVPIALLLLALPLGPAWAARPMKWENLMLMRAAAEKGDPKAQFLIGLQYKAGDGVDKDAAEAAKWLRQAAESGHTEAQNALGAMLAASKEPSDVAEAEKWLQAAAGQGNTDAMLGLGGWYARTQGGPADAIEAVRWYLKAAEAGRADACKALADIYARGQGVARDLAQAMHWYRKADELGDTGARFILGRIEAVTKAVTDDPEKALAWWRAEAEKGDIGAGLALELIAARKRVMEEDPAETVRWSLLLSGLRGAEAYLVRGLMLENGLAVNRNLPAAISNYRKAAELGHPQGQFRLGLMYAEGRGVEKDNVEAGAWLGLALENGVAEAANEFEKVKSILNSEQREAVSRLVRERAVRAANSRHASPGS